MIDRVGKEMARSYCSCDAPVSKLKLYRTLCIVSSNWLLRNFMSNSKPLPEGREAPIEKGPHDPNEINPKMSSDIQYWAKQFNVTGQKLHEAIRVHGTHVAKVREALNAHKG